MWLISITALNQGFIQINQEAEFVPDLRFLLTTGLFQLFFYFLIDAVSCRERRDAGATPGGSSSPPSAAALKGRGYRDSAVRV